MFHIAGDSIHAPIPITAPALDTGWHPITPGSLCPMGQRIEPGANNGSALSGLVTVRHQIFAVAAYFLCARCVKPISNSQPEKYP